LDALKRARRPYRVLNGAYYGLIAATMVYSTLDRTLQEALGQLVLQALGGGPLKAVVEAFSAGQALLAIGLIFAINLLLATLVTITLPSLIVPFSGLLLLALRAVIWGILFAPQIEAPIEMLDVLTGLGIAVLILLEGQGYVLGGLGAFVQGRALLWPSSVGAEGPGQGYWYGLKEQAKLYALIAAVLLVAAVYEVLLLMATTSIQ
jgi:hypothetical protein